MMKIAVPTKTTDGNTEYNVFLNWTNADPVAGIPDLCNLGVDRRGDVYVLSRSEPCVRIFNSRGEETGGWTHPLMQPPSNANGFGSAHAMHVSEDDHIYITTWDYHQVLKFTREGELVLELGTHGKPRWAAPFNHPTDVTLAADGEIYVSDGYGNARVHRFTHDGELLQSWGEPGAGDGEFACPHSVVVTADNRVIVADRDNNRLQVFDRKGQLLDIWYGFPKPMSVWSSGDDLFVADQTPRIARVSLTTGRIVGAFRSVSGLIPHGISGTADGSLFVADILPYPSITKYEATSTSHRSANLG